MKRASMLALVTSCLLASCERPSVRANAGPTSGPTSPSPSPTKVTKYRPEPCRRPPPTEVLFDVRQGVDPDLVALLRDAVDQARRYFRFKTRDCEPFGTSVQVTPEARGPWAATVYSGNVYVRGGDEAWTVTPIEARYTLVFHEWYHLVQDELTNYRRAGVPDWLAEGSAEWMGYRAAVHYDHYPSFDYVRAAQRARALSIDAPLERLARNVAEGDAYAVAFMAIDVLDVPERTLLRFWRAIGAGERWRDAFESAFGEPVARFYRRFERARAAGFP